MSRKSISVRKQVKRRKFIKNTWPAILALLLALATLSSMLTAML